MYDYGFVLSPQMILLECLSRIYPIAAAIYAMVPVLCLYRVLATPKAEQGY